MIFSEWQLLMVYEFSFYSINNKDSLIMAIHGKIIIHSYN